MPSVIFHGIIGYIFFGFNGLLLSLIPDIVGFIGYFYKLIFVDKTIFKKDKLIEKIPMSKMSRWDWLLYDISHSLLLWFLIYIIFREKFIYAAIFSILLDVFLHSKDKWYGPAFLYPLSNYRFDGMDWLTIKGHFVQIVIILLLLTLSKKSKNDFIDLLP